MNSILLMAFLLSEKGIINGLDWVEISSFSKESPEYKNSLAVGVIYDEEGHRCSGGNLGNNIVATAGHCCGNPSDDFSHTFNNYNCFVLSKNTMKDICQLKCDLPVDFPAVKVGSEVTKNLYILHKQCNYVENPRCAISMKLSPGKLISRDGSRIDYDMDTLPGSSGAGIFNDKHEIVGVHHSFLPNYNLNSGSLIK